MNNNHLPTSFFQKFECETVHQVSLALLLFSLCLTTFIRSENQINLVITIYTLKAYYANTNSKIFTHHLTDIKAETVVHDS